MSLRPPDLPSGKRRLTLLGATGSIGTSTLDIVARHPDRFEVVAFAAHKNWQKMMVLIERFRPKFAVLSDHAAARLLENELKHRKTTTTILAGDDALATVAALPEADTIVAAITGAAGLPPIVMAARHGKRILLANKEALVIGGAWFMNIVRANNTVLLPLDSEHNAIFQCLPPVDAVRGTRAHGVRKIILTASGGPFLNLPSEKLNGVTPEDACAHPVWKMGQKISVDSATMMNKGLEVIEAHWLFGMPPGDIEVVIHPQSIVHSFVEYEDGSTLAQLGTPDMRTPIAQALAFPERIPAGVTPLDLARMRDLSFSAPDIERFPCLTLAYGALRAGGGATTVLNAANEVAVAAFLARQIRFTDISAVNRQTLAAFADVSAPNDLDSALALDQKARRVASERIAHLPAPDFSS